MGAELPEEIKSVMENGIPAWVISCSRDGIPNTTVLSEVYYVDRERVALSFQFFNKTVRNIRENPHACVLLNDVEGSSSWILHLRYDHSETEGPIFDQMDMRIEAIASASGMSGIFKLKAADIYEVKSLEKLEFSGPLMVDV
jgi:Pyridoxamine 5'-phosphate oxidase